MSTSPKSRARRLQTLLSMNYYNVLHKYVRTMVGLLFGSPAVLPREVTRPSLESTMVVPISKTNKKF